MPRTPSGKHNYPSDPPSFGKKNSGSVPGRCVGNNNVSSTAHYRIGLSV